MQLTRDLLAIANFFSIKPTKQVRRDDDLYNSVSFSVLRDLFGLQSRDDVGRLSKLLPLRPDLLQFFEQLSQLYAQLSVILLQLATLCCVARCRLAGQLTS